jgi:hypothetical protein
MKKILTAALLLSVAAALPAQKLKDKLNEKLQFGGKESSLQDKKITSIALSAGEKPVLAPGGEISIGMTATLEDGKEMKTQGLLEGKVKWGNYIVTVTGGTFYEGTIRINSDPRKIQGYKVSVKCALFKDSTQFKTMDWTLDFVANYTANFDGAAGENGKWADKGATGRAGSNDSQGRGGDGEKGGRGQDGEHGGNGRNGQSVDVYVTAFKTENGTTLLKVYCKSKSLDQEDFFIVNPNGGTVTISARGGQGGQGGHGGDGGGGGSGGNGHERGGNTSEGSYGVGGTGGDGGDGGNGGNGGDGGDGGNITIYLDPSAAAYAGIFKYDTSGGERGLWGSNGSGQGPGGGGDADTHGQTGRSGHDGKMGEMGRSGQPGPKPTIITQKINIDWDNIGK